MPDVDRLFLDANVLFSAAYREQAGIVRLWELKNVELTTSAYAAEEARLNLAEEEQRQRLEKLRVSLEVVLGQALLPPGIELPEKDKPILQAAIYAEATHLLTGDNQHFGRYYGKKLAGVLVLWLSILSADKRVCLAFETSVRFSAAFWSLNPAISPARFAR